MRRTSPFACVLLTAVALGGCNLAPAHRRPDGDAPPAWRDGAAASASLANTAWFSIYQDPTLQELVREAVAGSVDVRAALARIDEARALAVASGAALYPEVGLSASAGGVRSTSEDAAGGDRNRGAYALSFDLTWEIDVFGRIRNETAAAQARYFASIEGHRDVTIRLVAEVARAYFELRSLDEQLLIAERTLKSRSQYVTLAKDRYEGGKTSELDFRQAEGEYYRTEVFQVEFRRRIALVENLIGVLLGRAPRSVPRGRSAVAQPLPPSVPAGLPSDLLVRRPDIRLAEQALIAETALVGAARANLYPRIALTGSAGFSSDALSDLFTSPATTGSLIAGLLQPIFNAGRNRALVDAQCARMRIAMEAYRKVVLEAFREVEDGLEDHKRYSEQRAVEAQHVQALRRVLELSETRYEGGVTGYLEVLDAQRALFDAEIEEATVIEAQLASLTRLYKALGGGWEDRCAVAAGPGVAQPVPGSVPSTPPSSSTLPAPYRIPGPPPPPVVPAPVSPAAPAAAPAKGS